MSVAPDSLMFDIPVSAITQRVRDDQSVVALIGMIAPPCLGVISFLTFFEHTHFAPGSERSKVFEPYTVEWAGAQFMVIVFPKDDLPLAEPILAKLGLTTSTNTLAVRTTDGGLSDFPVTAPNVYTLRYVDGHFAYTATPAQIVTALSAEREALKREFKRIRDLQKE